MMIAILHQLILLTFTKLDSIPAGPMYGPASHASAKYIKLQSNYGQEFEDHKIMLVRIDWDFFTYFYFVHIMPMLFKLLVGLPGSGAG